MTTIKRLALQFSDGSFGVLSEGATLEKAKDERAFSDENETRPEHLTKIVRVEVAILETVHDAGAELQAASLAELLASRAEIDKRLAKLQSGQQK